MVGRRGESEERWGFRVRVTWERRVEVFTAVGIEGKDQEGEMKGAVFAALYFIFG